MRRYKDYIVFQEDFFGSEIHDSDYVPPYMGHVGDNVTTTSLPPPPPPTDEPTLLSWSPKRPPPPLPLPSQVSLPRKRTYKRRRTTTKGTTKITKGATTTKSTMKTTKVSPDMSIFGASAKTCHHWTMAQLEAFRASANDASWTEAQHVAYARVRRKIKNRISAANSRKRHRDTITLLERENKRLAKENETLRKKLDVLL